MENLTLTSSELNVLKKAFASVFALITSIIAVSKLKLEGAFLLSDLFRLASGSLVATALLFLIFYKWVWRLGPLPKLIGRPVVQGIWIGRLYSNYGSQDGRPLLEKPIVFVVRQTYLTLSIQSFTDTQVGESKVEALIKNKRIDSTRLAYVFELKNEYAGTTKLVNGAGDLQLIAESATLNGNYWTSSPTSGTLVLRHKTTKCDGVKQFEDAVKRWPLGPLWGKSYTN